MSKFGCRCGAVIRCLSGKWTDYEFILIPKSRILEMIQRLRADTPVSIDDFSDFMCEEEIDVILCPECNRIYIQKGYMVNSFHAYIQEHSFPTDCSCIPDVSNAIDNYDFDIVLLAKIEEAMCKIDHEGMISAEDFCKLMETQKMEVYRCPKCERLWVRKAAGKFIPYKKEPS
jgi:Zn-finger nucleic acid-binding protein